MRIFLLSVGFALSWFCLCAGPLRAAEEYMPWRKGTVWSYAAKVDWVDNQTKEIKSDKIRYEVTVVDTYASGAIRAARLRGFVFDLAWYEPGKKPSDCLLVQIGPNHLFLIEDGVEKLWPELARGAYDSYFPQLEEAQMLLEMPLTENARWGDLANSPRDMYCWIASEGGKFAPSSVAGAPRLTAKEKEFEISCRTNPDATAFGVVRGLGIIWYSYHHHGTTSDAVAQLVKYKP
ncbi:hypothetical protein BH09VER1_BH09VER1_54600 [soil metagenome]